MLAEGAQCEEAKGFQAFIFFFGLYLVALGSGCLKPNMISHGADQFRRDDPNQSKKLSHCFNTAYFSFCFGELVALTVLVWVLTHSGMDVGFGVSAAAMAMGLISVIAGTLSYRNKPPQGSILTQLHKFLDKACIKVQDGARMQESPWRLRTVTQVEQVKIIISVVPIFACTIIFNTILAQLQTFSVQQGRTMDCQISKNFQVPPASLQSIPYIILIFLVPFYETTFIPLARRVTGKDSGITPLQWIGVGLFASTFSMVAAALVVNKRRSLAQSSNKALSIFWIAPQFLIFGVSEMFTAVGLIEFFYKQSLVGM